MRRAPMTAPRWAAYLATGVFYGVLGTRLQFAESDVPLAETLVFGALGGLLLSAVFGVYEHRRDRESRAASGLAEPSRTARRAAWRGPAPVDPEDRRLALGIVDDQLHELGRQPVWMPVLATVFIAIGVWLALTDSPVWWGPTVVFVLLGLFPRWTRHRLTRRRALLNGTGDQRS